ncbi:colicin immunity protein [Pseudomonas ogarae]|uniref:Colicin immunity protein n=1 Tax=Pseudomonas ogarae (strain DSM 112162 / CECT 30235 / F113) TaxID=1114970 RepID=A0ABN5G9R7_PSEO1|nr:colicin immunity protein [Pseudomonas ogarae]AEV61870.1 colicin immunity protein [Pseudomonas ogarae]AUO45736.1 colicin immunity protein [Pseudomonas ogarae]
MNSPRDMVFESATDFFSLEGSVWMRLSPTAAVEVCMTAAAHGRVVARIEGGIWHSPGFEARLDCIWDGADLPISESNAHLNNLVAGDFIREEMDCHTAFILTAPPITGWPHKTQKLEA